MTKFALALVLPAFVPPEPFPPLANVTYKADAASPWRACPAPSITDGDTIRCGTVRVRLLGIDAPELHGCPRYRRCAPGDGNVSRRSLAAGARLGPVRFLPVTTDRYGRTIALVEAGPVNLSCWQLGRGEAIYKPQWDNGGRIARDCH